VQGRDTPRRCPDCLQSRDRGRTRRGRGQHRHLCQSSPPGGLPGHGAGSPVHPRARKSVGSRGALPAHQRRPVAHSREPMTFEAGDLVAAFSAAGVEFYTGVADSLLAPFNAEIERREGELTHIPAPNEGSAVAVAAGYHAASGRVPVVYLQNSGLGNAWNPLVSLTDPGVYGIPMVLVIGWRGEPGRPDEPQHLLQGEVMLDQLRLLRIPIFEIPSGGESLADVVESAAQAAIDRPGPSAIVVRKGDLSGSVDRGDGTVKYSLRRADVIATLLEELPADTVFVATTGYAGRELAQLRDERHEEGVRDLLVVGSMGHASSIAF